MDRFFSTIGLKIILVTLSLAVAAFAAVFFLDYRWHRENMADELAEASEYSTDIIQSAFSQPMMQGNDRGTTHQFEALAKYANIRLYLTDHRGEITYSNDPEAIRKNVFALHPLGVLPALAKTGFISPTTVSSMITLSGKPYFMEVRTIPNAPSCHHCHGSARKVLGAMVMFQDVADKVTRLDAFHLQRTVMVGLGLAVMLLALLLFIKASIINRMVTIVRRAEEVMRGNLDVPLSVPGRDELARLSEVLSEMVANRREAERELARLNHDLEGLVSERTADLGRKADELEEAYRKLRDLDRMKTVFLATVSHELKTPQTSVLGFAKLIRRRFARHILSAKGLDPEARRAAEQIDENLSILIDEGARLSDLIEKVMDLTELESGRAVFHLAPADPAALLRDARREHDHAARKKRLAFRVEAAPDLPRPVCDAKRVAQVLGHLVSNAVTFTDQGSITLSAAPDGHAIRFTVTDTGPGIDSDDQKELFASFRQLGDYLTDKPGGVGVGLALCKSIVAAHGGRIWVESAPGRGSAFSFTLPLADPDAA